VPSSAGGTGRFRRTVPDVPLRRGRGQAQAGRDSPPTRPVGGNGKTKWPQAVPLLRAGSIPALPKLFLPGSVGERQAALGRPHTAGQRNTFGNVFVSEVFLHQAFARQPCRGRTCREFSLHFSRQAKGVTKHGIFAAAALAKGAAGMAQVFPRVLHGRAVIYGG